MLKCTSQKLNFCNHEDPGDVFRGMPMDRPLNENELAQFKATMLSKRKVIAQLYQHPGLARKVRLSKDYVHTNSRNYSSKGHKCMLCRHILK